MRSGKYLILILLFLIFKNAQPQCSDAGVCIISDRHQENSEIMNATSYSLQYILSFSGSPEDITYHTLKFAGDINISKEFYMAVVVPVYAEFYKNSGQANIAGLGDAFLLGNYFLHRGVKQSLVLQGGFKLNTSSIDKYKFTYLNAQGTNDLILGADYKISMFSFSTGFQFPLSSYTDGDFKFKRGADFLLKAGIGHKVKEFDLSFDVLAIKRLQKSEVSGTGYVTTIDKSNFFQVNLVGGLTYKINPNVLIDFGIAIPVIKREENSDGTKRVFSANAGINFII